AQLLGERRRDARTQGARHRDLGEEVVAEARWPDLAAVVLVHQPVRLLPAEVRRERRRLGRRHLDHLDLAAVELAEQRPQRLEVHLVLQAGAPGLQEEREIRVAGDRLEQSLAALAIQPERHAMTLVAAWQEQRAAGVLAEAR